MVGPAALRLAVDELQAKCAMKKRRACRVVGLAPATYYYRARRPEPVELREKFKVLAAQRPRWGYRRLHVLLKREGHHVNHKLVFRVYRAEGLAVRRKKRKRMASALRVVRPPATRPREQWTMDFTEDSLSTGRRPHAQRHRHVHPRVPGHRGGPVAARAARRPGPRAPRRAARMPEVIRVDNGSEFTNRVVDSWAYHRGIKLEFIRPGKPIENAHIESFNGKFRDECLNENWFISLDDARRKIEAYRTDYNEVRPHSSLDNKTPTEFTRSITGLAESAV